MVYFIGAGPGDVDLITVKGRDILTKADVTETSYIRSIWLVAPKKISPDFLKKPLVVRLFRPFL